jgi:hypothetical protein
MRGQTTRLPIFGLAYEGLVPRPREGRSKACRAPFFIIFFSRLSARCDREELDPKFFFVELEKNLHNQFAG